MNGISVIIPAHNEEHEAGKVVAALATALPAAGVPFEIIAVNDASTDQTHAVLQKSGVKVMDNERNLGYGASLKKGIGAARYDTIAIIDADNTYPAEEIPALFMMMGDRDMAVGARKKITYPRMNWLKQRGRDMIDLLCSLLAGTRIPDINSGLRLFKRERVLQFMDQLCDRFSFTTSLTLLMFFNGCSVVYTPVDYCREPTKRKTKVRIWKDGWRTLLLILGLGFRNVPVRAAAVMTVPAIALAVIVAVLLT